MMLVLIQLYHGRGTAFSVCSKGISKVHLEIGSRLEIGSWLVLLVYGGSKFSSDS